MKIKICGITNLGDATECQTLGVNYLGLFFTKRVLGILIIQMQKK